VVVEVVVAVLVLVPVLVLDVLVLVPEADVNAGSPLVEKVETEY
jgi:hypothetical protein